MHYYLEYFYSHHEYLHAPNEDVPGFLVSGNHWELVWVNPQAGEIEGVWWVGVLFPNSDLEEISQTAGHSVWYFDGTWTKNVDLTQLRLFRPDIEPWGLFESKFPIEFEENPHIACGVDLLRYQILQLDRSIFGFKGDIKVPTEWEKRRFDFLYKNAFFGKNHVIRTLVKDKVTKEAGLVIGNYCSRKVIVKYEKSRKIKVLLEEDLEIV